MRVLTWLRSAQLTLAGGLSRAVLQPVNPPISQLQRPLSSTNRAVTLLHIYSCKLRRHNPILHAIYDCCACAGKIAPGVNSPQERTFFESLSTDLRGAPKKESFIMATMEQTTPNEYPETPMEEEEVAYTCQGCGEVSTAFITRSDTSSC